MSKPLFSAVLIGASVLMAGCGPNASNAPPTGRTAPAPHAGLDNGPPAEQAQPSDEVVAPNADPGMDPNHDKTHAEGLPSGDTSSRAAPNDGDAEPPARP